MNSFLTQAGYAAIILLGFLAACCVPVPSEITFGFGGVLAYQGHLNLALVIVAGTLAEVAGSYVSYAVGRVAERPLIERLGRFLLITERDMNRAESFLSGRGWWAIPLGRTLPLVRSFTSVVAGITGVPALRFGLLSLIGTAVYASALASIGYAVGSAWHSVARSLSIAGYVAAAVVVGAVAAFLARRLRQRRREARAAKLTVPSDQPQPAELPVRKPQPPERTR